MARGQFPADRTAPPLLPLPRMVITLMCALVSRFGSWAESPSSTFSSASSSTRGGAWAGGGERVVQQGAHGPAPALPRRPLAASYWCVRCDPLACCAATLPTASSRNLRVRACVQRVCAHANNQHELASEIVDDLAQTSFARAMQISKGTASVVDGSAGCFANRCPVVSVSYET